MEAAAECKAAAAERGVAKWADRYLEKEIEEQRDRDRGLLPRYELMFRRVSVLSLHVRLEMEPTCSTVSVV